MQLLCKELDLFQQIFQAQREEEFAMNTKIFVKEGFETVKKFNDIWNQKFTEFKNEIYMRHAESLKKERK